MKYIILILFLGQVTLTLAQSPGNVAVVNLQLWMKANANAYTNSGTTLATDGQTLQQWNDQTTNLNHANQTTASRRPTFRDNATNNANYNPVVEVDNGLGGANRDFMSMNQALLPSSNAARTLFVVAQPTGSPNNASLLYFGDHTSPNNGDFIGITLTTGIYRLHCGSYTGTSSANSNTELAIYAYHLPTSPANTGALELRKNGLELTETDGEGVESVTTDVTFAHFGAGDNASGTPGTYWDGFAPEFCVYNTQLIDANMDRIETYMAIKYGITLDNTGAGAQGDYTASNGTSVIWDASLQSNYHNNIIGIGRDDNSSLIQKQSHTLNDTTRLYISTLTANNSANTGSFTNNLSYIASGDNQGLMCATPSSNAEKPASINSRLEREWKVTNTNFSQIFNADFTLNSCVGPGMVTTSDLRLLVDLDGNFSDATVYSPDGGLSFSYAGDVITVTGISNTHIPNNSTRYITIGSISISTPLPIELLDFSAIPIGNRYVKLDWQTASEINNDYFTIEQSKDGLKWERLFDIDGAGNSSSLLNYTTTDNAPYFDISYYRLKQTDFDGKFSYSQIESVNIKNSGNSNIEIFPNPTKNQITIVGGTHDLEDLKIYNVLGQDVTIFTKKINSNKSKRIIDLSKLSEGTYYIKTKTTANKVYKQ